MWQPHSLQQLLASLLVLSYIRPGPAAATAAHAQDLSWQRTALQPWLQLAEELEVGVDTEVLPPAEQPVVFWHIGSGSHDGGSRDDLIVKQLQELQASKIWGHATFKYMLNVQGLRKDTLSQLHLLEGKGLQALQVPPLFSSGRQYFEFPTLWAVHTFCKRKENHNKRVGYVHSKSDDRWRQGLETEMLEGYQMCETQLNKGYDVCGPKYTRSLAGWCHFSGNFWWARCSYIRSLSNPYSEMLINEQEKGLEWAYDWPPYGRYYAEYWILNGQTPREEQQHILKAHSPFVHHLKNCTQVRVFPQSLAIAGRDTRLLYQTVQPEWLKVAEESMRRRQAEQRANMRSERRRLATITQQRQAVQHQERVQATQRKATAAGQAVDL